MIVSDHMNNSIELIPEGILHFNSLSFGTQYLGQNADGLVSFLSLERGELKRFSFYEDEGVWRLREVDLPAAAASRPPCENQLTRIMSCGGDLHYVVTAIEEAADPDFAEDGGVA